MKSILLLTNGSDDGKSSSWTVFKKFIFLIRQKYNSEIHIFRFTPKIEKKSIDPKVNIIFTILFSSFFLGVINKISLKLVLKIARYYSKKYSPYLIKYINENHIDKMWVYCDILPSLLLDELLKKIDIKYHLTIFDDPFSINYSKNIKNEMYPIFERIIRNADSIDTPSFKLLENYKISNLIDSNIPSNITYAGIFKRTVNPPIIRKQITKICLAGSIFGIDALNHFLIAIEEKIQELGIEFHIYTTFSKYYINYIKIEFPAINRNIKFYSYIDENIIIDSLQKYDLLYLPLYFGEKHLNQSITSFPSKTHNYLASGVPIVFHVPQNTSLHDYAVNNKIGCVIDTLDHSIISNTFSLLLSQDNRVKISKDIMFHNEKLSYNHHIDDLHSNLFFNNY